MMLLATHVVAHLLVLEPPDVEGCDGEALCRKWVGHSWLLLHHRYYNSPYTYLFYSAGSGVREGATAKETLVNTALPP